MSIVPSASGRSRPIALMGAVVLASMLYPALAEADCGADLGALMNKRMSFIAVLNKNTRSHGGKLDPVTACPQLRSLAAAESSVVAYMVKNKDWCSIPDDLVSKMTESRAKSASIAVKACDFAVKMKKMQQQQAQQEQAGAAQQAVKLPTGPL